MNCDSRIKFLEESHRILDKQISLLEECKGPVEDIAHLKKKKLHLKDEMSRLRGSNQ